MTDPPVIVREWPQPSTGGTGGETTPLLYRGQYIIFEAQVTNPIVTVEVLAGDGAPTASGGYAKWAHIPRPQRVSLTVFEGYEPMTLTVPVLFDSVRNNGVEENCENQIQWLEWMAGRGVKHHPGFQVGVGKPARVVVYTTHGGKAKATPLVPVPFQSANLKWFVEDIVWDEHPLRSSGGARIRQAASVKLVQYVQDPVGAPPKKEGYKTFHTTRTLNTLKKLVLAHARGTPAHRAEAVKVTLKENAHNRAIGSHAEKALKLNTAVRMAHRFLIA